MSLEHYKNEHALDGETILDATRQETEVTESVKEEAGDPHEPESVNDAQDRDDDHAGS